MRADGVRTAEGVRSRSEEQEDNERYLREFKSLRDFHGAIRAMQLMTFCRLWAALDNRPLAQVEKELKQAGVSRAAMYRYVCYLREWHNHLVETSEHDPGSLEEIARHLAFP